MMQILCNDAMMQITQNFNILLAFLLITIALLVDVNLYYYLIKY